MWISWSIIEPCRDLIITVCTELMLVVLEIIVDVFLTPTKLSEMCCNVLINFMELLFVDWSIVCIAVMDGSMVLTH